MLPRMVDGQQTPSPLTVEHLAVLMDRTTMVKPEERTIPGLININTAPATVLACLEGLSEEHIQGILASRETLDADTLASTVWLVSEGVMDVTAYEKVAPHITARGQQFTIESVGYADHMGMVTRLQVVVDMNGPIAQTVYYRDISNLGSSFPIRESDKEKIRGH
jgi:type II secretory pathway component PulK